jgi:prostaglandin-E synthase 1
VSVVTASPAFPVYAIATVVLSLNLLALWVMSGAQRVRGGVAINPEDGARYNAPIANLDPPNVARYLRAHRNAESTIYPFLFVGTVYVLTGGNAFAIPIFSIFVVARIAHSIVYLRAMQPWRTVTFALSLLALIALVLATLYRLVTG